MSKLMRYTPFPSVRTRPWDLDRFFEDFFSSYDTGSEMTPATWTPRLDLTETDKEYLMRMDLPGIPKEDVTVNVQDGQLTVSGERKSEEKTEDKNFIRMERHYGSFFRTMSLPHDAVEEKIEAVFKNGVLNIRIPKTEISKPKHITVK